MLVSGQCWAEAPEPYELLRRTGTTCVAPMDQYRAVACLACDERSAICAQDVRTLTLQINRGWLDSARARIDPQAVNPRRKIGGSPDHFEDTVGADRRVRRRQRPQGLLAEFDRGQ